MSDQRVLRLRRINSQPHSFVLVHVLCYSSQPLHLKLIASEGDSAYSGTIDNTHVHKIRAQNYVGSDAEFEAVLSHTLLSKRLPGSLARDLDGLECVASVVASQTLSVIWQRQISGITQRLGVLELKYSDEVFDLWDASALGAQAAAEARQHGEKVEDQLAQQVETVKKLQAQLQSLKEAKQEHESALLQKFSELLNSKKLKIRNQQRLLSSVDLEPETADRVLRARSTTTKSRASEPSRASKRGRAEPVSEAESSDGFDDADAATKDADEGNRPGTPDRTDDETEDEGGDDDGDDVPSARPPSSSLEAVKKNIKRSIGGKVKAVAKSADEIDGNASLRGKSKMDDELLNLQQPISQHEQPVDRKRTAARAASQKIARQASPVVKSVSKPPLPAEDDDETDDEL